MCHLCGSSKHGSKQIFFDHKQKTKQDQAREQVVTSYIMSATETEQQRQRQPHSPLHDLGEALYSAINHVFDVLDPHVQELGLLLLPEPAWFSRMIDRGDDHVGEDNDDDDAHTMMTTALFTTMDRLIQTQLAPALQLERSSRSKNATVAPIVIQDHRLGLAYWCLPALYKSAYSRFSSLLMLNDNGAVLSPQDQTTLLQCTRCMLLINADCYTAWHRRKKVISHMLPSLVDNHGDTSAVAESALSSARTILHRELQFLNLLGTKHPKSGESWHHRWWILKKRIEIEMAMKPQNDANADSDVIDREQSLFQLLNSEMMVAERMAVLYPRNYYAWTHRQLIVKELIRLGMTDRLLPRLIESELRRMDGWTRRNVSDHSGFHHIMFLLQTWYRTSCQQLSSLSDHKKQQQTSPSSSNDCDNDELLLQSLLKQHVSLLYRVVHQLHYCQFLIVFYPGHESLWIYRRLLWKFWLQLLSDERVKRAKMHHDMSQFYDSELTQRQMINAQTRSEPLSFIDFLEHITSHCAREYERQPSSSNDRLDDTDFERSDRM